LALIFGKNYKPFLYKPKLMYLRVPKQLKQ
jgi:hypothetical protein